MGGNTWVLAGFWLALSALELSQSFPQYKPIAQKLFERNLSLSNQAGFFSEQVDSTTGTPYWVMPIAWSHAFYLWADKKFNQSFDGNTYE